MMRRLLAWLRDALCAPAPLDYCHAPKPHGALKAGAPTCPVCGGRVDIVSLTEWALASERERGAMTPRGRAS